MTSTDHALKVSSLFLTLTSTTTTMTKTTTTKTTTTTQYIPKEKKKKIPQSIHITTKSRCLTPVFAANIEKWRSRLPDHSLYLHDDIAIDRFLNQPHHSILFPQLRHVLSCLSSMAAKTDIWRYLLLFEFGGIYADFDSVPNSFDGDTIHEDDESFFVVEQIGVMSQYFMCSQPVHPLMYYVLHDALKEIWSSHDVERNNPPFTTGPHALKCGFITFMKNGGKEVNGYEGKGVYVGDSGRTVRIEGVRGRSNGIVVRDSVMGKQGQYEVMNMTHFSRQQGRSGVSCQRHVLEENLGLSGLS